MTDLYIGVISGTSLDAIDVACMAIDQHKPDKFELLHTCSYDIPVDIQQTCRDLISHQTASFIDLLELDTRMGLLFAEAINQLLIQAKLTADDIKVVGSHGQTLFHHPHGDYTNTLQIGNPNVIVEQTGITTIADVRRRDMAAHGQGAPLVPVFHNLMTQEKIDCAVVNIGGIANITYQQRSNDALSTIGFDTGTGNGLIDAYCREYLNQPVDVDGVLARSGAIVPALLQSMLADDYFSLPVPKSTGTEYFNLDWLKNFLATANYAHIDVLATLTELTATSIASTIDTKIIKHLFVCGGGAHNIFMMERLQQALPEISVTTTSALGIDPDWVEACTLAYLAYLTLQGRSGNICSVSGATHEVIMGAVYAK